LHVIKSKKVQGKNAENPIKSVRRLASSKKYISPNQLTLDGFETPFEHQLTAENRWVKLSRLLPWDSIVSLYDKQFTSKEGRPPINGRIVIGAVIIKHMLNLSDRETISQIQENMFMQYFLGYSSLRMSLHLMRVCLWIFGSD
jgi:transposase, IS5 family